MRTANVTRKLLEKPYKLGGQGDAYDCLSLLVEFYRGVGFDIPEEWHGWTRDNYAERWAQGEGREDYYKFLCERSDPVDMNYMKEHDFIIMRHEGAMYTSFYLGNDNVLCVTEKHGIKVLSLKFIQPLIAEVRRMKR